MKKYLLFALFIKAVILSGCDNPAPTELVEDPNSSDILEVEIIGKDPENEYYSTGFDTSGVTENVLDYTGVITVSGIKITRDRITDRISSAQAVIFDKSRPFRTPAGILLGYNTITPGIIRFDNNTARFSNYRIKYRESGFLIDTVLGRKYELFNLNDRLIYDPFVFRYNFRLNFSYNAFIGDQTSNFDIPTPEEVTGSIKLLETETRDQFRAEISWTPDSVSDFYVIVGGVKLYTLQVFPIYRIKTMDDGKFVIPATLLRNIPREKFGKITISLVRRFGKLASIDQADLYVVSQSIHTIIVDFP